jgi:hypothetical protein
MRSKVKGFYGIKKTLCILLIQLFQINVYCHRLYRCESLYFGCRMFKSTYFKKSKYLCALIQQKSRTTNSEDHFEGMSECPYGDLEAKLQLIVYFFFHLTSLPIKHCYQRLLIHTLMQQPDQLHALKSSIHQK